MSIKHFQSLMLFNDEHSQLSNDEKMDITKMEKQTVFLQQYFWHFDLKWRYKSFSVIHCFYNSYNTTKIWIWYIEQMCKCHIWNICTPDTRKNKTNKMILLLMKSEISVNKLVYVINFHVIKISRFDEKLPFLKFKDFYTCTCKYP